ncbi:phosphatidylinositol 4,5-bisphosphate 3-kinase catalytic subunit alpha isoform-like [Sycon ciliatum]|uniref:phosphatidylinositol 4,5-bisphosphate 3-kinase catalytic subunit alpha isoform-like n=1 Tax=Sycon ciliatum TaxID=27933 RepID=UPI0031F70642
MAYGYNDDELTDIYADLSQPLDIDCLLPTGVLVPVRCMWDSALEDIKAKVWSEAKSYPMFNLLKAEAFYVFVGVNMDAEKEELIDEHRRYCDLNLFHPLLQVVEKQGDQDEKLFNAEVGNLIGKRLQDLTVMGAEVHDYRCTMLAHSKAVVDRRGQEGWLQTLTRIFPPDVHPNSQLPASISGRLRKDGMVEVDMYVLTVSNPPQKCSACISLPINSTPDTLIERTLQKRLASLTLQRENPRDYVVKVCGCEEYLLQSVPLSQYRYVRACIVRQERPQFTIKRKSEVMKLAPENNVFHMPVGLGETARTSVAPTGNQGMMQLWAVDNKFKLKVVKASNVNADSVLVRAGIFHGGEPLSDIVSTRPASSNSQLESPWNENLVFDIDVRDLPRSARLCFVIYGFQQVGEESDSISQEGPLAWVNINIFDYNGMLRTGSESMACWPCESALEEVLNPIGGTVANPNVGTSITLHLELDRYAGGSVMYPSLRQIEQYANSLGRSQSTHPAPAVLEQLHRIVDTDSLGELDEQDQKVVWQHRDYLSQIPQSLPKLLRSVQWNSRDAVAQMLQLLAKWRKLNPEDAMELLDYLYADTSVRKFAVECLEAAMTDDQLSNYLLQLVQVLKYEPYLDCPLGKFLLTRALNNQLIGHFFFWHMRAEMHNAEVSVRFAILLEAYCRGSRAHTKVLTVQQEALVKLRSITELLRSRPMKDRPRGLKAMRDTLQQPAYMDALSKIPSPLNPIYQLNRIILEKCKFMDSKMKPLWLVFENQDAMGKNIYQIYKNGDDLRQDMLTLQIIRIMDNIWKAEGLDFEMTPYGCLSSGDQVGLIEVVLNAETIANIQCQIAGGASGAFKANTLYMWLQEKNKDPAQLQKAIQTFTNSCAGYCVATYVLGIGDRHSDNIMLRENGQLLHIDFGHFLGNFKSKFGVKRERVPFVLTDDFVYVISEGQGDKSRQFEEFKAKCENAFMLLRKKGNLLLNLFVMMLSCGIPELQSLNDIMYVRNSLALGMSDAEAQNSFRSKFTEAMKNSWSVSWNWYIHNVAHKK